MKIPWHRLNKNISRDENIYCSDSRDKPGNHCSIHDVVPILKEWFIRDILTNPKVLNYNRLNTFYFELGN